MLSQPETDRENVQPRKRGEGQSLNEYNKQIEMDYHEGYFIHCIQSSFISHWLKKNIG